jgi:hypothetical protein
MVPLKVNPEYIFACAFVIPLASPVKISVSVLYPSSSFAL